MVWKIYKLYQLLVVITIILAVVPISISQSEDSNDQVSESWGTTDIKIAKQKFTWTINNYKFCCQKVGDIVKSPTFSSNDGCKWYLEIYPKGSSEKTKDGIAIFVYSVNCNTSAIVKLGILNSDHKLVNEREFSNQFQPTNKVRGYNNFIPQINLVKEENELLPDQKLTIVCEITSTLSSENSLGKFVQPKSLLLENFGILLENEVLTDVILTAGGKEFKAHRAILAARSPVFKALFEDNCVKRADNLVRLTNVDPKAVSEMLRYIYTEEAFNLEKVAPNLLAAAENYELDGLKILCENTLRLNISIENAINFFILGDTYRADDLKKDAKRFIAAHISELSNTSAFKSLILSQPRLVQETFEFIG